MSLQNEQQVQSDAQHLPQPTNPAIPLGPPGTPQVTLEETSPPEMPDESSSRGQSQRLAEREQMSEARGKLFGP